MTTPSHDNPTIQFSNWHTWADRNLLPDRHLPGVYLIAKFHHASNLNLPADPLDENVIYIGEAADQMISRWRSFDNAVFGKVKNRRAKAYAERFADITASDLFLAIIGSSPLQWESGTTEDYAKQLSSQFRRPLEEIQEWLKYRETAASAEEKGVLNQAWVKFVERKLIFDYVRRWGKLPAGNSE
jgi:hypothetical protein